MVSCLPFREICAYSKIKTLYQIEKQMPLSPLSSFWERGSGGEGVKSVSTILRLLQKAIYIRFIEDVDRVNSKTNY